MTLLHCLLLACTLTPPRPPSPSLLRWRELSRRLSPAFVSARDRAGHTATGLVLKVTLLRF